jgi:hypothetical protein
MGNEPVRLRPHHLLCGYLLPSELTDRGPVFTRALARLRDLVELSEEAVVEVIQGVDNLCASCPDCGDERCESVFGDENKVRKWDGKILEGLGLAYHDQLAASELRRLIREKAPLAFCRERCPWATVCRVFQKA